MNHPQSSSSPPTYHNACKLYTLSALTALGWVTIGYNYSVYNPTVSYLSKYMHWPKDEIPLRHGLGFAMIPIGALLMILLILWKLSEYSRRKLLILADIFTIIGAFLTAIEIFSVFLIGRLVLGLAMGINGLIVPIYIREMAPKEISGKMGSFSGIGSSFGKLLGFALAFGLPLPINADSQFCRFMYSVPGLLSVIRISWLTLFFSYDTPKYYILHDKESEAKGVMQKIYQEELIDEILDGIKHEKLNEKEITNHLLFQRYPIQLQVCTMLAALMQLTGIHTLTAYSTAILTGSLVEDDLNPDQIREIDWINFGMGIVRVFSSTIAGFFLDKHGRKSMLLTGTIIQAASLILLGMAVQINLKNLAEAMILVFSFGVAMGFGLINPIYYSEVLPSKGCGLMLIIDNIMNLLLNFSFPLLASIGNFGFPGSIYLMSGFAVAGVFGIMKKVVETKELSMYEIYSLFDEKRRKHPSSSSSENSLAGKEDERQGLILNDSMTIKLDNTTDIH